jgi:hypothetical protein
MKTQDIFTPFTYPTVTFIDEHLTEKEVLLKRATQTGGIITTISGPSKSGKTVFVQKTLGKDNVIHITGLGVLEPFTLWNRAFSQVGTPIRQTSSEDSTFQGEINSRRRT